MLRYDGPLRLTLRFGVQELALLSQDLNECVDTIGQLAASVGLGRGRGSSGGAAIVDAPKRLSASGEELLKLVFPPFVRADLSGEPMFVEIGTDDTTLLEVPWELMRDPAGFIALRHWIGRYVNLKQRLDLNRSVAPTGKLRVLLISVPNPQPIGPLQYEKLTEAEHEFDAISNLLLQRGVDFEPLVGNKATKEAVKAAFSDDEPYTIIHFTGHGHADGEVPMRSGLVLHDGLLTSSAISAFLRYSPVFAFINGCETTKTQATAPGVAEDPALPLTHLARVFGISRPFLDRGSYVLGTRWRVSDDAAEGFARAFYNQLLDGKPVGEAIMQGRQAIADETSDDLSWTSYVFYGDPRLVLETDAAPAPSPPAAPPALAAETLAEVEPAVGADLPPEPAFAADAGGDAPLASTTLPIELADVARRYEALRATEKAGNRRTLKLERLLDEVRRHPADPAVVRRALAAPTAGERIVGAALAQIAPSDESVLLLSLVEKPKSNFEQYHAIVALHESVPAMSPEGAARVRAGLIDCLSKSEFLATDRAVIARETIGHLDRRFTPPS